MRWVVGLFTLFLGLSGAYVAMEVTMWLGLPSIVPALVALGVFVAAYVVLLPIIPRQ